MPIRLLVSNNQSPVMVIEIARPSSPIMSIQWLIIYVIDQEWNWFPDIF